MMDRSLAVVTGASSGIGEAFARALAARGFDLMIVARRLERLEQLAQHLRSAHGIEVHAVRADLATVNGVDDTIGAAMRVARPVELLVNNAGIGSYGAFAELPVERELEMVDLNVRALVALTGHFLPQMISRGRGGILQVASTTSFQPVPYMATYGASKAFVLHFSEAIAREVQGTGVRVIAVCPGHTPTEFQKLSGVDRRPTRTTLQPADEVVAEALLAYESGRHIAITGWPNRVVTKFARVLPRRTMTWVLGQGFRPRRQSR